MLLLAACATRSEVWRITESKSETESCVTTVVDHNILGAYPTVEEDSPEDRAYEVSRTHDVVAFLEGDRVWLDAGWEGKRAFGKLALTRVASTDEYAYEAEAESWRYANVYAMATTGTIEGERSGGLWVASGDSRSELAYTQEETDLWTDGSRSYLGTNGLSEDAGRVENGPEEEECEEAVCFLETSNVCTQAFTWEIEMDAPAAAARVGSVDPEEEDTARGVTPAVTVAWGTEDVEISISGASSAWEFGMAETSSGDPGWYGEDCYLGTTPFTLCHPLESYGGVLAYVDDVDSVEEGRTTLFDDILAYDGTDRLTYYLSDGDRCWAWGHEPGYYSALGCVAL